jgi:hypothetical protein
MSGSKTFGKFVAEWAAKTGQPPPVPRPRPTPTPVPAPQSERPGQGVGKIVEYRPCRRCGSSRYVIKPGKGPHAGRICCRGCGAFGRWLARREMAEAS